MLDVTVYIFFVYISVFCAEHVLSFGSHRYRKTGAGEQSLPPEGAERWPWPHNRTGYESSEKAFTI